MGSAKQSLPVLTFAIDFDLGTMTFWGKVLG
jgi:hypothetical protein